MGVNCDSEMDGQENFITQVIFQYMKGEEGSYEKIWEKYISGKGNAKARRLGMSKQQASVAESEQVMGEG